MIRIPGYEVLSVAMAAASPSAQANNIEYVSENTNPVQTSVSEVIGYETIVPDGNESKENSNRVISVVVMGDSNMAGPVSMGNIMAAQDENFLVYRDAQSGKRTETILKSLYENKNTIEAIKSAQDLIFWAGGNSVKHATKGGGLEKIYERIKEINPRINLIVFDIQHTNRKSIQKGRNKVNETNRILAEDKLLIDEHIKTNELPFKLEYISDGVHLTRKSKQELTAWIMKNLFKVEVPNEFNYARCFEGKNAKRFIEITKQIKNYKPRFNDLPFAKQGHENKHNLIPYRKGYNRYYFPRDIDPQKHIPKKDNISAKDEMDLMKLFGGKGIPTDSLSEETGNRIQYEEYISKLPLAQRLKIQNLVIKGAKIVEYKEDVFRPKRKRGEKRKPYRYTPQNLRKYDETIRYSRTFQDSLGNDFTKRYSRTSSVKTLDNISVLYDMAIICTEMEENFPGKYDAQSLFVTMLSVGSVESMLNSGIPKEDHVESLEGSTKDFGMFQLNYHTAKDFLMRNNPTFWSQFFSIDKKNREVIFKSNHGEIMTFAYMLQLTKLGKDGLPKNGEFEKMAYEVAAWHSKTPRRRKIYARALLGYMKAYYKILQDNRTEEEKSDLVNKEVRQEMKQYAGKNLPKSSLSVISKYVVDNQEATNNAYPTAIKDFNDAKKTFHIRTFSEIPSSTFVHNAKALQIDNDLNPNTNLKVDKHGDISIYLEHGVFYKNRQTPYSVYNNKTPLAVDYTNDRLADRNEKHMQLILCAEKDGEILFLNDRLSFDQLPAGVQAALNKKYDNNRAEINTLFLSDMKHAYEVIFYAYQEAGYRIEVRVGDEDKFRFASQKERKESPYMTDKDYFKNKEQPRFMLPPYLPVLLKDQDQYLILNDYMKSMTELFKIDKNEQKQRERAIETFNQLEKQYEIELGYRVILEVEEIGNKTANFSAVYQRLKAERIQRIQENVNKAIRPDLNLESISQMVSANTKNLVEA